METNLEKLQSLTERIKTDSALAEAFKNDPNSIIAKEGIDMSKLELSESDLQTIQGGLHPLIWAAIIATGGAMIKSVYKEEK